MITENDAGKVFENLQHPFVIKAVSKEEWGELPQSDEGYLQKAYSPPPNLMVKDQGRDTTLIIPIPQETRVLCQWSKPGVEGWGRETGRGAFILEMKI